jgi:predicted Zn-dependent protease with MMP-like domain
MDRAAFQAIVDRTVESLPEKFKAAIAQVVILVRDAPECPEDEDLLGVYEGIPVTEWDPEFSGKLPDTITLFRENIEAEALEPAEMPHIIRETLLHEIAHHFGFEHDRIDGMEERWVSQRDDLH